MLRAIRTRAAANLSGRLVGVRSGKLRGTVREVIEQRGGRLPAGRVGSNHPIAPILEGGARPHAMGPRTFRTGRGGKLLLRGRLHAPVFRGGRLLRFKIGGRWIATRRVLHPGVQPRRWLATAVAESQPDIDRIMTLELERAFEQRVRGRIPIGEAS